MSKKIGPKAAAKMTADEIERAPFRGVRSTRVLRSYSDAFSFRALQLIASRDDLPFAVTSRAFDTMEAMIERGDA